MYIKTVSCEFCDNLYVCIYVLVCILFNISLIYFHIYKSLKLKQKHDSLLSKVEYWVLFSRREMFVVWKKKVGST